MGSKTRRDPGAAAPRGRRRRWLIVSGIGLVVLALAGFGLYQFVLKPNATAATFTRTATAATQTVQTTVGTTGTLEPKRQADLSFSSSGTVTKVYVKVGDQVAKGEVLARIDDASLKADVAAAKADVQAAQSTLSDLQDNDDSTATAIASATAQLKLKNNALSQARSALKAAALRSTIKGTVAEVDIAKGDQVGSSSGSSGSSNSSSSSSSSSSAITVISTNRYVVSTSVGSADLSKVKVGLQAVITPTGATDSIYGTVATVGVMASSSSSSGSGTSSSSTASFPVTIEVTEAQKNLFAGASATVSIIVEQRDNVLVVPTAAITTANGKTVVQKLVNGSPVETEVTVGSTYGSQTEITKGLSAGDEVQISFARQTTTGTRSGSGTGNQNGGGGFGGGTFGGGGGFGAGGGGFGGGSGGQGGFTRTGQGG